MMTWDLAGVVVLVLALSQWVKTRLGLQDRNAEIASFVIGLVLGVLFWWASHPPATAQDWLILLLVGLGMALVPSGLFKIGIQYRNGTQSNTLKK